MMNIPQPVTRTKLCKRLKEGAKCFAEWSVSAAVKEIKEKDGICDIGLSVVGTWQKGICFT